MRLFAKQQGFQVDEELLHHLKILTDDFLNYILNIL